MNVNNSNMQDEEGQQMLSFTQEGEKIQMYGPKI